MKIKVERAEGNITILEGDLVEKTEVSDTGEARPVILVTKWPEIGSVFSGVVVVPYGHTYPLGKHGEQWTKNLYWRFRGIITMEQ